MLLRVQGHDAYCYTGGKPFDPALPAAVFIHGAQNDHSVWTLQTRYFAHHGFGVLAVDLPGHGRSKGAPLSTVEAMADWLLALLDAAGMAGAAQATLIGHSMGSLVALEAASRAPRRIRRLGLVGTAYPMKVSDALLAAALNDEQKAIEMVALWSHLPGVRPPSRCGPGFSALGIGRRLMQRVAASNPAKVFHTDFAACNAYANGIAAAQSLACPVLLLLGKRDMMTPPKATAALAEAIADCKIVQIDDCGHALLAEQPDAVLDALFSFSRG